MSPKTWPEQEKIKMNENQEIVNSPSINQLKDLVVMKWETKEEIISNLIQLTGLLYRKGVKRENSKKIIKRE